MRLKIDRERFEVHLDGKKIQLTNIQFDILDMISSADGKVVIRSEIMKTVWGWPKKIQSELHTNTLNQQISRLRRRLRAKRPVIRTVFDRGYAIIRD